MWGLVSQAGRGERTQGVIDGLVESGIAADDIIYLEIDDATNADPTAGIPIFTGMFSANPDLKAAVFDHGNLTSTAQSYLEAAGLGPDDLYVAGFDLSPATVAAIQGGFTDLVIDQQQFLQGFEAVAQICLTHNYGFSGLLHRHGRRLRRCQQHRDGRTAGRPADPLDDRRSRRPGRRAGWRGLRPSPA